MRNARALILCSFVLWLPTSAFPDSLPLSTFDTSNSVPSMFDPGWLSPNTLIDPRVGVRKNARGWPGISTPLEGLDFSFLVPAGSGDFSFYNANEEAFRTLTFTIFPGGPGEPGQEVFTCSVGSDSGPVPFSDCTFLQRGSVNTPTEVLFGGGPGLAPMSYFNVDLGGFPQNTQVSVDATFTAIPEPGTLMLCFSGVAALMARPRRRKRGMSA